MKNRRGKKKTQEIPFKKGKKEKLIKERKEKESS